MKRLNRCSILASAMLLLVSLTPVTSAQTTVPGLIHLWSGEGNANDSVGSADGVLGETTDFGPGVLGQAFSFDGQETSVINPLPVNINSYALPQMTMGMWVNLRSVANNRGWVIGHDDGGYDRSLNLTDSRYDYGVAGGTGYLPHTSTLIKLKDNLNTWHCVAVSYDASAKIATFYADGETQTVYSNPGDGLLTATLGGLTHLFLKHTVDGLVDEVFMFDRALTPTEIDQVVRELSRVTVDIDIKPGSYPNSINLGSNGVIPVAVLSSDTFDATQVEPDTVALAGGGVALRGKGSNYLAHQEDVNGDGLVDLVLQVETENLDAGLFQDGFAELTGNLYPEYGGTAIYGLDEITIVPLG